MKKISLLIMLSFILCIFFTVDEARAETLNEYIAKAETALKNQRSASSKKSMTEKEKEEAVAQKDQVTAELTGIEKEMTKLQNEIDELEKSIEKKNEEIKSVMKFFQISNGESNYLEYAFGATSFTDFIYRLSVAEQLSDYNNKLIKEYNADVKEKEDKQTELTEKQTEKKKKQEELNTLITKLANEIDDLSDNVLTYQTEYKNLMTYVNQLKNQGCLGNEDMSTCLARQADAPEVNGGGSATSGGNSNGFYIPLTKGRVTQNYKGRTHNAIDISNYEGAPVYPITDGVVINILTGQSCGKNIVFIKHKVNGSYYTTVYYHLKTVNVRYNQVVSYSTQIGTQGGNPSYDSCTTGSHVDVKLFKGIYGQNFYSLTSGPHMDPRTWLTQLPAVGRSFSQR